MTLLASQKLFTSVVALPGERVVWEGGPSRVGIAISLVRWLLIFSMLAVVLLGITFVPPDERPRDHGKQLSSADFAVRQGNIRHALLLIISGLGGVSLLGVAVQGIVRTRTSWYLVTTERVCIQRGGFSKELAILDLDKIVAVHATASAFQQLAHLQSITLVQTGIAWTNKLTRFANSLDDVHLSEELLARFLNEWLPRDNISQIQK